MDTTTVRSSDPAFATFEGLRQFEGVLHARIRRALTAMALRAEPELVEEILQEVYCRLLELEVLRRWRGRTSGELAAYLGTIAERTTVDLARQARASKRDGAREVHLPRNRMEQIPDPRQSPERDLLLADAGRAVLRRCRTMTVRGTRARNTWVARLALLEGWTSQEIAHASGGRLSPGSVSCLIHRIRRRLVRDGGARRSAQRPAQSRRRRRSGRRREISSGA